MSYGHDPTWEERPQRHHECSCGAILFGRARICRTCARLRQIEAKRLYDHTKRNRHKACPQCGKPIRKESISCPACAALARMNLGPTPEEQAILDLIAADPGILQAMKIIEQWQREAP